MTRLHRPSLLLAGLICSTMAVLAAEPPAQKTAPPDLFGFRTVDTAVTTRIQQEAPRAAQPGYLGIQVDPDAAGRLVVSQVDPDSPAAKAGVRPGDRLREVAGQAPGTVAVLRDLLRSRAPGDTLILGLTRQGNPVDVTAILDAPSHPLSAGAGRAVLGVQLSDAPAGARIDGVVASSPAAEAGLRKDDVIVEVDGKEVSGIDRLRQAIGAKRPGDLLALLVQRQGHDEKVTVKLATDRAAERAESPKSGVWKKDVYRLAVVPIEFADVKHNGDVTPEDWERALFSKGTYTGKSATGQPVYGSLNDYYREQSCGAFHVEGKVFSYVAVSKKRADYNSNPNRAALLGEAVDFLQARDGDHALDGFDGIFFLYAGERFQTARGALYWPHRSTFFYQGKRWSYFICPEGGEKMSSISVIAHEFGHMLGLPDLYAKPEAPGAEGLGVWCTMSTGHGKDGKPLHLCAWCKEQLGWLKPAVIDPRVRQKLVLSPIEGSPKECFKVLLQPDGSEYLLLENRERRSFDRDLPGQGLLIWHVVDGRPVLEESHGATGPDGASRFLGSVPYPSEANTAFTPVTTPSSASRKGGGLPVNITNIRRLPDGRITFWIGYEYL